MWQKLNESRVTVLKLLRTFKDKHTLKFPHEASRLITEVLKFCLGCDVCVRWRHDDIKCNMWCFALENCLHKNIICEMSCTFVARAAHTHQLVSVSQKVTAVSELASTAWPVRAHAGTTLAAWTQHWVTVVAIQTPGNRQKWEMDDILHFLHDWNSILWHDPLDFCMCFCDILYVPYHPHAILQRTQWTRECQIRNVMCVY